MLFMLVIIFFAWQKHAMLRKFVKILVFNFLTEKIFLFKKKVS